MMKKYDLIKAVVELWDLDILDNQLSLYCISEIVKKTTIGTNKNFSKKSKYYLFKDKKDYEEHLIKSSGKENE